MNSWIEVLVAIQSITQTEIKQAQLQALLLVEKKRRKQLEGSILPSFMGLLSLD